MDTQEQHQMIVRKTYPTGAQEWFCPICGRHIILQWPPNYKRIILNEGDTQVVHAGGTCEPMLGPQEICPEKPEEDTVLKQEGMLNHEDPYLLPWLRWIGDRDF